MLGKKSVLHGTWIAADDNQSEEIFFVWAEREAEPIHISGDDTRRPRIRRHPYAATTIEIAELLAGLVPEIDWHGASRLTRVAYLPSSDQAPTMPGWLYRSPVEDTEDAMEIEPWRIEGLNVPLDQVLYLLVTLPMVHHETRTIHRLGNDLI